MPPASDVPWETTWEAKPPSHGEKYYFYSEIERGLGAVFGANEKAKGSLRGRLKHLSQLGLPDGGPGKGARRLYSKDEVLQLLLAMLLADLGVDPTVAVPAIKTTWPDLEKHVRSADKAPAADPAMLVVQLQEVSGPWTARPPLWIGIVSHSNDRSQAKFGWFCVRNLTEAVKKLRAVLDNA